MKSFILIETVIVATAPDCTVSPVRTRHDSITTTPAAMLAPTHGSRLHGVRHAAHRSRRRGYSRRRTTSSHMQTARARSRTARCGPSTHACSVRKPADLDRRARQHVRRARRALVHRADGKRGVREHGLQRRVRGLSALTGDISGGTADARFATAPVKASATWSAANGCARSGAAKARPRRSTNAWPQLSRRRPRRTAAARWRKSRGRRRRSGSGPMPAPVSCRAPAS